MVKSKTSKMHLEVNNDVKFDITNESTSKRNRKSKNAKSTRGRKMKVSGFKSKPLMPSIILNGKRIPLKSTSRKMSASAGTKKKVMQSRKKTNKKVAIRSSMKSRSSSKKISSGSKKRSRSISISKKSKRSRSSIAGKMSPDANAKKRSRAP